MKTIHILLAVIASQAVFNTLQAQTVTLVHAKLAEDYILKNHINTVVLWCACCLDDSPELMSIKKLYHKAAASPDEYEMMMVPGATGREDMDVSVTNMWVKEGSNAVNLGHKFNLGPDSCTATMPWTFGK